MCKELWCKLLEKRCNESKRRRYIKKYSLVGNLEDFRVEIFAHASFGIIEHQNATKFVMRLLIILRGKGNRVNPLHWKSKVNDKVTEDIKCTKTLALETAVDNAIYLADMISEVYNSKRSSDSDVVESPLLVNEVSKFLVESLYSTKKVKWKTMWVIISSLRQNIRKGKIEKIWHVSSKEQLAHVLTKKGVSLDCILDTVSAGTLKIQKTAQLGFLSWGEFCYIWSMVKFHLPYRNLIWVLKYT